MAIVNYRLTNDSIVRVFLWAGLTYSLFYFRDLLLTLLVGLVIASTIDPLAKFLTKYRIPRSITVLSVFVVLFGIVIAGLIYVVPTFADDLAKFISRLPTALEKLNTIGADWGIPEISSYISQISKDISKGQILTIFKNSLLGAQAAANTVFTLTSSVVNFLLMIIFAFYLAVQENGINNFLKLITPKYYEPYILDLWARSERKIASWAKGQILVGVVVAVIVYISLKFIGMPYASLFALMAFVGEMIPVVGLLLASIPAIIFAYLANDITFGFVVAAIFFVISQVEQYVIYPKIMNKVIGVPAIITLISVIIGAKVAGFWGILLAVPLAAIAMEFINDILQERLPSRHQEEL